MSLKSRMNALDDKVLRTKWGPYLLLGPIFGLLYELREGRLTVRVQEGGRVTARRTLFHV